MPHVLNDVADYNVQLRNQLAPPNGNLRGLKGAMRGHAFATLGLY
jgi:hypothetical protein